MGILITTAIASLDGRIADADGDFTWAFPDDETHAAVNDLERPIGTYLLGRRMYEVMRYWETEDGDSDIGRDYAAIWRAADKVVYSSTLAAADTARTRIERNFDPDVVRDLVAASERDVSIAGPDLAAHAFRAGLVHEISWIVVPAVIGNGPRFLPDDVRLDLDLIEERRIGGMLLLRYRVTYPPIPSA